MDIAVGSFRPGVERVPSLERAFAGIDKLLLISAPPFGDAITQHLNVVTSAGGV